MSFRIDQLAVLNLATVGNSITAGSFVRSGGTSSQFLKADGTVDTNAYITGITSTMVTTALGYTPVPNTRNITINGVTQDLSVDRTWTISAGVASVSGSGAGISVSPTTGAVVVSNTGVTSNVAGTGISVSGATGAVTITNTGVTSIVAGTAITISGATGAVTINNAGVTSLNGSTGALTGFATQAWVTSQGYITSASVGNGTLTLAVSGSGLSGSASFTANQSTATTFTVTSNATTSATANTIAYRDSGGDLYARYFFGSYVNTSDNDETGITRFVIKNGDNYHRSATTTTAMTVIRGVASGTWGIDISGNSATTTNFRHLGAGVSYDNDRTTKVSGGLAVYSGYSTGANRPTTYDISAQFSVNGNMGMEIAADWISTSGPTLFARSLRDCCQNWSSWITLLTSINYNSYSPTLTGGGASGTWSINITGNAGYASSAGNADTVDGYHASTSTIGNYIVVRDGNGYIFGNYINMTDDGNPGGGTSISSFITKQGDNYYRSVSPTNAMVSIRGVASGSWGINVTGTAGSETLQTVTSRGASTTSTLTSTNTLGLYVNSGGASYIGINSTSSWAYISLLNNGSTTWDIGAFNGGSLEFRPYGGNGNRIIMTLGGNLGVNNTNPSYRLHVGGDIYADGGWLRVSGTSGLYFETYGGGWHMNDSTWIRSYNGKNVYMSADVRTGGQFQLESGYSYWQRYGTWSSSLHRIAYMSFDWDGSYNTYSNHGISSTDVNGSFSDSMSINSFNDINLRLDSNGNNGDSYVRFHNDTTGNNVFSWIGFNGSNYAASFARDIYVQGGTGGNFGNRLIVGGSSTPYTLQDSNIRPTVYLRGQYPVLTLDHTVTSNTNHGPTIQFTFDGLSNRQWLIGCGGSGTFMDFGFSNSSYGNSDFNPHNGIAGYSGNTIMRIIDNAVGIGGDWGAYGGGNPAYTLDVRGTIYSNTDMRAPIFYDSADTSYYWNPNTSTAHRLGTPYGYLDLGPMNGSWCHFQTDRPRFYFGNSVTIDGDLRRYSDNALYIHSANYNSYSPTLTGGGASGTWGIDISGNSATTSQRNFSGDISTGGMGRFTGWYNGNAATGLAAEIGISSGEAYIIAYNRQTSSYGVLNLESSAATLRIGGSTVNVINGSLQQGGNQVLHAGNYTSYTLPIGGGWYGVNMPGSRWGGYAVSGGEIVFGNGLPNAAQMGILIDGAYVAGENNGFWSLPSNNDWNGRRGMYWDGSYLNFTANSPTSVFTTLRLANGFELQQGGSNYGQFNSWVYLPGFHGLFSAQNNAHFYPNNGTYGSWIITGSRGGWGGIEFGNGSNGSVVVMISNGSNESGFHNNSYGWQIFWSGGALYSGRNTYGGNHSRVLQEDIWINSKYFGSDGNIYGIRFYDANDSSYYLDPASTSELNSITTGTRARWGEPRLWTNRQAYTSDQGYWTGTNGWGTAEGNWDNAWKGGFSGWDIWGTGTAHPQGSGYIHAQGIVSGQHYANSDGSSGYGWMMVGAADATANRYWLRGKWGSTTSGWVEMITSGNIGSQNVNYASQAGTASFAASAGNTSSISSAVGGTYTWTGIQYFQSNLGGYCGSLSGPPLQAYSTSNNSAFFSFHKSGVYAVNMGLDADSVLRIGGWSAASNRWQLDMSGNMTVAGDVTAYSDARVKENVETVEDALDKVLNLRGVYYNRTDSDDKRRKVGVIAQEILEVIPEVVGQDNDGMYNVSYGNIVGVLIEAIKEQQQQIEELKAKLDAFTK